MSAEFSHVWAWCIAGLMCLGLEVLLGVPVVLLFFAFASFVTAAGVALGLITTWPREALTASVTALVSLWWGRNRLLGVTRKLGVGPAATLGEPLGAEGLALDEAAPGDSLRVELYGVPWSGRNVGTEPIGKGRPCKVVRSVGLRLDVVGSAPSAPGEEHV